ncbi:MAG: HAMP domain-containing sensor histidine kinase [Gemmatimonadota bacterium]
MSRHRFTQVRSTVGFTIGLMGVALLLTTVLAYEAWKADRNHRDTVHKVLREYAQTTAFQFIHSIIFSEAMVPRAFGGVAGLHIEHGGGIPPVTAIMHASDSLAKCSTPEAEAERFYFRYDMRDGSVSTEGFHPTPEVMGLLADTIKRRLDTTGAQDWYLAPKFRQTSTGSRALLYVAVRELDETPVAAFGFETCNAALWEQVFRGVMLWPLLPPVLAGSQPNDSLLSVDVSAGGQFSGSYQSPVQYPSTYSAVAVWRESRGVLNVKINLRPDIATRLVIGGLPRSRLPMLIFLLVLTGGILAVAIRQLARERELLRLRSDFTSSVSHELRTPLSEILLFAETLEMDRVKDEAGRREALQIIVQEARHLAHIVDNVLQFSRAERRMLRLKPERTVLSDAIRESTASFTPLAASYGVHVAQALDDRISVPLHRGALHQVLLNLLDNAVKYGPPGQTITIRTTTIEGVARLEVEDEGPGIAVEDREKVWEPFIRVATPQSGATGSGIGLAVVRELVNAHRGRCWIESNPLGGTRIVVEIPGATLSGTTMTAGVEEIA